MEEIEALHADIDDIQKASEELQSLALQRKEDLVRTKERMDVTVTELRGKVETEFKQRSVKSYSDIRNLTRLPGKWPERLLNNPRTRPARPSHS